MNIKNSLFTFALLILINIYQGAYAKSLPVKNVIGILNEISLLAEEFDLTIEQKNQMQLVLLDYLPVLALKINRMINNRIELIDNNLENGFANEDIIVEIANKQGLLLSDIIITKEHMKKEIRLILNKQQKQFVDELIEIIIQFKLEHR